MGLLLQYTVRGSNGVILITTKKAIETDAYIRLIAVQLPLI